MTALRRGWSAAVLFSLAAIALVFWNQIFGFRQFGGDGSVLLNAAWLEYNGQVPYLDFKTACPPLFLFPLGLAFRLDGVSWAATVDLLTVFSLVTFSWQTFLFRRAGMTPLYSTASAWAIQAITLLPSSWWWYNPITGMAESMLMASAVFLVLRPGDRAFQVSFVAAEILVALAKINTAVPMLAGLILFLLVRRGTRKFALVSTVLTAIVVALLFLIEGASPLQYLQNVHAASSRAFSPQMWWMCFAGLSATDLTMTFFVTAAMALVIPLAILERTRAITEPRERLWLRGSLFYLALVALGIFVLGGVTNNDLKLIDAATLITVALCLGGFAPVSPSLKIQAMGAARTLLILGLVLEGLVLGWSRQRVLNMGYGQFWETGPLQRLAGPPCLEGMVCGPRLPEMMHEAVDALAHSHAAPADRKVFVGFRIDGLYPILGLQEPKGLPLWWEGVPSTHLGDAYPSHSNLPPFWEEPAHWIKPGEPFDPRVQAFFDAHFDVCIFWRGYLHYADMAYLPSEIRADLHDHFTLDDHYSLIVVYRRK